MYRFKKYFFQAFVPCFVLWNIMGAIFASFGWLNVTWDEVFNELNVTLFYGLVMCYWCKDVR